MGIKVEFRDMQGLIRFGYRRLTEARFLLLRVRDAPAARAWLSAAPVSNAEECDAAPATALQVAFTVDGLQALGVPDEVLGGFSIEFRAGMAGDKARSRLLGDTGANAPEEWIWGGPQQTPHVLVLLYAQPGRLAAWAEDIKGPFWEKAFDLDVALMTSDLGGREPFGFADSLSQPLLDWENRRADQGEQLRYGNLLRLGEVVLGYPNEYGRYTDRPLLSAAAIGGAQGLPPAADHPGMRDLGRNGCYLVLRTLEQDVPRFWRFADARTAGDAAAREAFASAMVGRQRNGTPLAMPSEAHIQGIAQEQAAQNQFTFDSDPQGARCPLGAHIRRANPRNADLPTPPVSGWEKILRLFGLARQGLQADAKASVRFHRILRRGREYGSALSPQEAIASSAPAGEHGIHFIALMANLARQFEFLQSAWIMSSKFDALSDESDPLLGNREPVGPAVTDTFSQPRANDLREKTSHVPQFVTVRGGAYFFMPSLPAIRYFSQEQSD